MSYVPPHARTKNTKVEKKEFKKEFPQLAPPIVDDKPKLDFKKLFKNNEKRRQAKAKRMRWGMIKLTQNGVVDSLSVEERQAENLKNDQFRIQLNLDRLGERLHRDHIRRLINDPEYEAEEVVTSESEPEPESDPESESSYAEDPEEDEF